MPFEIPMDAKEKFLVQSCALSLRELPPLQSGHRWLMSAINVAFGADGITSMMKEAFSGMHTSVPDTTLCAPHSLSFSGWGPVMSRQYLPGSSLILVKLPA
jgi:hypothetical protein